MPDPQAVASRYAPSPDRRRLWKAAIKWPMYSVAVMPVLLAAGWRLSAAQPVRWGQCAGFLMAAVLLLLWENLSNDLFDADTGMDAVGKPHSVVALLGRKRPVRQLAWLALLLGLLLMLLLALRSTPWVLVLVAIAMLRSRHLFAVVMLSGIYSLLSAAFFVSLDAVDVAFTEAAVGAGDTSPNLLHRS